MSEETTTTTLSTTIDPQSPSSKSSSSQSSPRRHRRRKNKKTGPMIPHRRNEARQQPKVVQPPLTSRSESNLDMEPLENLLRQFNNSQIEDSSRLQVIEFLEASLVQWARSLSEATRPEQHTTSKPSHTTNPWQKAKPTIVSFGSHRLGVSMEDSDLDLLVVAPPHITREDFFVSWVEFLSTKPNVECVHPIPEAYTPVLRFECKSVSIDMLFVSLSDGSRLRAFEHKRIIVPKTHVNKGPILRAKKRQEYHITDADLKGQDEAGLRSLNGARVCQMLIDLVPDLDKYQVVLRAVKQWATRKGIYSNVLGFLGGINCAILVARVCCFHPKKKMATPAELLVSFFNMFAAWSWPVPVLLTPIQLEPPPGVPKMRVWDPAACVWDSVESRRYAAELMPIITPAYPSMNSAYNVALSQLRRMQDEFAKAWYAIQRLEFEQLFGPVDFFARHQTFLQVSIHAKNRADFVVWFRWVESRLRFLINTLETPEIHAYPQSRFYYQAYNEDGKHIGTGQSPSPSAPHEALFFIALQGAPGIDLFKFTRPLVSGFLHQVNRWNKRDPESMGVGLNCINAADLPACCFERSRDSDEELLLTSTGHRYLECDSHSGKVTPQTSQGSVDDDSFASECSEFEP